MGIRNWGGRIEMLEMIKPPSQKVDRVIKVYQVDILIRKGH